ncbi:MAG TPA: molybdate ABC transporter substrate-binding protein [Longimicrobiales bacterium]|nr:molybdate ABC transporter substrate-binding protein [Longimicrobiales bacterium]
MKIILLACAVALGACTTRSGSDLVVAAASDLAGAMPELAQAFEAATGQRVVATLGSSGQLAQQILQGAPVDVFLSADAAWVDRLAAAQRIETGSPVIYAYGVLVLLAGRQPDPPSRIEALREAGFTRVALASPEHAPYGRAALQAMVNAGVHADIARRLVLAENVRQAVQFAENQAVDAAIVALSLMDSSHHRWTVVPASLHDPLAQTAAIVAGTHNGGAASAFLEFLTGPEGRAILDRHRFILP